MTVLVTGSEGFAGRYIADYLQARVFEVWRGTRRNADLTAAFGEVVVHCAAAAGPWHSVQNIVDDNIIAMQRWAERWRAAKLIIFLSSVSIFGDIQRLRVDENHPVVNPDTYGMSKLIGERLLAEWRIPSVFLRCPGIVGPNCRGRNWLVRLAENIQHKELVKLYNPQGLFNSVIHIRDIAEFIVRLIGSDDVQGQEAMILAADDPMPIRDVAARLARDLMMPLTAVETMDDCKQPHVFDSTKAKRFGFRPQSVASTISSYATDLNGHP